MIRSLLVPFIGVICFVTVLGHKGNCDRQVLYKPSLVAIINEPAKMGVILDYSSRLIVVLNGKRSAIIVVHLSEHVRYYLNNEVDTLNKIWSNFKDYFEKLPSLQSLLKTGQEKGEKSELGTLKEPVRGVLEGVFNSLEGASPMPVELSLLTKFIERLRAILSLVYRGSGSFRIAIGVDRFAERNLAVADLLSYSEGKLTTENVYLNATEIFEAQSGAEVLLTVLSKVGERFDLIQVFHGLFTSLVNFRNLLLNATGGSHVGLDGLITILADYVGTFDGRSSIIRLISSILSYNSRPGQSLSGLVNQTLSEVANQDMRFHNADGFSIYVLILRGIITEDYSSDNFSLSDIITFLPTRARASRNPLFTLVELLSSFYANSTIPHFFGSIVKQLNPTLDGGSTPENSNSHVFYKQSLIAIVNKSAKMAVIIDYSSLLLAVLNGNRSSIIVTDISEQVRYYLENATDIHRNIWSNFEGYFQKLSSLKPLLKIGQERGEKSKLGTLEEPVRGVLVTVFNSLGGTLPMPEELSLLTHLIKQLRGSLSVVYRRCGSFRIDSGVDAFTKVNLAVAALLSGSEE